MYPYPSGDLHIGHWYAMAPADCHARFRRMQGYNVLHPIGFDAFGLPAENAAISRGIHPYSWTMDNIENIQSSWVTQGREIGQIALRYGANDLGSIMIEENVVSQAGTTYCMGVADMQRLIHDLEQPQRPQQDLSRAVADG